MSAQIERPTYYEQQILAAADLEAQVDYSRAALARHERQQHSWGIVHGLALEKTNDGFVVKPGLLVDGTGRQIAVVEDYPYDNRSFLDEGVLSPDPADKDQWYPVFIDGIDEPELPSPFRSEQCAAQLTSRITEKFLVSVRRPGAELSEPVAPQIDAGPGGAPGSPSWPVLVGYIQWDADLNLGEGGVKDAQAQPEVGKSARYAGVYADTIAARGGSVTIRTREAVEAGKPALSVREGDPADASLLKFGVLQPNGSLKPLMTLNAKGDLEVTGKLKGTLAAGAIVAESGLVSDGVTIALPAGITQQQVDDKKAEIRVLLSPRIDPRDAPSSDAIWGSFVHESYVDDDRRAHCRVRWHRLSTFTGTPPLALVDAPATFSYLIVASVKQD